MAVPGAIAPGAIEGAAEARSPRAAYTVGIGAGAPRPEYLAYESDATDVAAVEDAASYLQNGAAAAAAPTTSWVQTVDPTEGAGAFESPDGGAATETLSDGDAGPDRQGDLEAGASSAAPTEPAGNPETSSNAQFLPPSMPASAGAPGEPMASVDDASTPLQGLPAASAAAPGNRFTTAPTRATPVPTTFVSSLPPPPATTPWPLLVVAGAGLGALLVLLVPRGRSPRPPPTERSPRRAEPRAPDRPS